MTVSALKYNLFQALRVHFSGESDPNSILSADKSSSLESNYASTFTCMSVGETLNFQSHS